MPSNTWNIDTVRSREAMTKVSAALGPHNDWRGVMVAHLDTGFTNHVVFNLAAPRPQSESLTASITWIRAQVRRATR